MKLERPNSLQPTPAVPNTFTQQDITECLAGMKTGMSRYIKGKGIDPPDDLLQDIAIATLTNKSFSFGLKPFVIRCMRNLVAKHYRDKKKRPDSPLNKELMELQECDRYITASLAEVRCEEEAIQFQHAQALGIIEKKLSSDQAIVLQMSFEQQMSTQDIATMMGTNQPRVRQLKRRGLQRIKSYMAKVAV